MNLSYEEKVAVDSIPWGIDMECTRAHNCSVFVAQLIDVNLMITTGNEEGCKELVERRERESEVDGCCTTGHSKTKEEA